MSAPDLVDAIRRFVALQAGVPVEKVTLETRLNEDLGVDGDDMDEIVEAFGREFRVDVSGYRWEHHADPEGCNPLWIVFRPWWTRVERIPIHLRDLVASAEGGVWAVKYDPKR
jgi:hypothetical protein